MSHSPETVVLWDVPESDFQNWFAAGCGEEPSFVTYQILIDIAHDLFDRDGRRVVFISPTTDDVLAELAVLGLANTPQGRKVALERIYDRMQAEPAATPV